MGSDSKLLSMLEVIADMFDAPCNWNDIDDYMHEHGDDWCEINCGNVSDTTCWQKYLELKVAEKEQAKG